MRILLILLFTQISYASFYSDSLQVKKEYSIQSKATRTDARYIITINGVLKDYLQVNKMEHRRGAPYHLHKKKVRLNVTTEL